jgi:flavin-dependent dehydrogenase
LSGCGSALDEKQAVVDVALDSDLPRRPYGPGWALVGDAGYFKDPFAAHGITAFRNAELLTDAVIDGDLPR